jgi:PAS domain S-box-containing protein
MFHEQALPDQIEKGHRRSDGSGGSAAVDVTLADLASESIIVCGLDGIVRYWNPAAEALYGWPALATIGRRMDELFAGHDLHSGHWRLLLQEGRWQGPAQRRTAAGLPITVSVRQTVRYDATGVPRDVVEYGRGSQLAVAQDGMPERAEPYRATAACWELDISEARASIEEIVALADGDIVAYLQQNPDRLERILARSRIVNLNDKAVRLFGGNADRGTMIARPILDYWPAACRPVLGEVLLAVSTRPGWQITQTRALNAGGFLQGASVAAWRSLDGTRADTMYLMVNGVVSDDRSAWELHASEDRYRKLIHHMPTALWQIDARAAGEVFDRLRSEGVTDIAGFLDAHPELIELAQDVVRVTEVNREAVSLLRGRTAADLIRPVRYLFAATPKLANRVMVAHFEGRRNFTEQAKVFTLDGQARDVVFSVTYPAPPEQLDTTFITMLDVTERLRTEAQLQRLEADHAHAARISTLGELTTSIAHEVKQPLAAIVTNGETSLRWLSRDDFDVAKIRQLTTRIVSSAYRANDIIQRIRSLAARQPPERAALDLADVAEEALFFVRHDIESRRIALSINAARGLPRVLGDRVQLQQVIVNLLVNSVQAISQAGRPARRIWVSIGSAEGGMVSFSIRDSGPGIAAADLDRIFESFFTTKEGGVGIGLAVCQSIVRAHGGCIGASNHAGGGAHLWFTLPGLPA